MRTGAGQREIEWRDRMKEKRFPEWGLREEVILGSQPVDKHGSFEVENGGLFLKNFDFRCLEIARVPHLKNKEKTE